MSMAIGSCTNTSPIGAIDSADKSAELEALTARVITLIALNNFGDARKVASTISDPATKLRLSKKIFTAQHKQAQMLREYVTTLIGDGKDERTIDSALKIALTILDAHYRSLALTDVSQALRKAGRIEDAFFVRKLIFSF